jgi:hypothetical protein
MTMTAWRHELDTDRMIVVTWRDRIEAVTAHSVLGTLLPGLAEPVRVLTG